MLLLPPVPLGRRGQVVPAMVTMGMTATVWWELEQQRAGSSLLLWLVWILLLPGRIVGDVVAVVPSSGSGGAQAEG